MREVPPAGVSHDARYGAKLCPKIAILHCDDWVAIYKDNQKVWEGHSCPLHMGLEFLGIPFQRREVEVNEDGSGDEFPERLHS
jgi:hypothetical protein